MCERERERERERECVCVCERERASRTSATCLRDCCLPLQFRVDLRCRVWSLRCGGCGLMRWQWLTMHGSEVLVSRFWGRRVWGVAFGGSASLPSAVYGFGVWDLGLRRVAGNTALARREPVWVQGVWSFHGSRVKLVLCVLRFVFCVWEFGVGMWVAPHFLAGACEPTASLGFRV